MKKIFKFIKQLCAAVLLLPMLAIVFTVICLVIAAAILVAIVEELTK